MSHKRKSRSIVTLPVFNGHLEVKNPEEVSRRSSFDQELGEVITNSFSPPVSSTRRTRNRNLKETNSPIHSFSTTGSDLEGILDLSTKLSGLSSSSSLSWSEDYELEITRKVHLELEKLDRAFQGVEDVPPPHDKDEVAEWKHFFPNICILDEKTPTNSAENTEASSESEDETPTHTDRKLQSTSNLSTNLPRNKNSLANKRRTEERAQNFLNTSRPYHTLPRKPKSLEIEKYLKISSLKSPDVAARRQRARPVLTRQMSKDLSPPEYTSLPFITAIPVKTEIRKPRRKIPKIFTLPPITNNFRSISATPRNASSKSMFVSLNFEKDSTARGEQISLKHDLMKLFDLFPISNR